MARFRNGPKFNPETTLLRDFFNVKMQRGFFTNLDTNNTSEFLLNPTALNETYEAVYARHISPGLSHQRMSYSYTKNAKIPLRLFFDQSMFDERNRGRTRRVASGRGQTDVPAANDVEEWRRFLMHFLYSPKRSKARHGSPAPVLFHWPGMISMKVRVMKITFQHAMFAAGKPIPRIMTALVSLEEDIPEKIYAEDILRYGTQRPWGSSKGGR